MFTSSFLLSFAAVFKASKVMAPWAGVCMSHHHLAVRFLNSRNYERNLQFSCAGEIRERKIWLICGANWACQLGFIQLKNIPLWLQRNQPELTRGVQIFQSNCKLGTTKQIIQVEGMQNAIGSLALYLEWIKSGTQCANPQALER